MTTASIGNVLGGLVPAPAGQSTQQNGTSGSTGDAFLALVQGLLDGAATQTATQSTTQTATGDPAAATVPGTPAAEDTDAAPAEDLPTTPLPDLAATAAMVVPALAPVVVQAQPAPQVQATATAATPAAAAAAATAATVATVAPVAPIGNATTDDVPTTLTVGEPTTSGPAPGIELPDVAVTRPENRPAMSDQGSAPASTPAAAPAPASTSGQSVSPITGAAAAAPAAMVASAPTDTHRVTQQVFPEVVRVATNPDGLQRITIKLNPEALGEVRVVLTSTRGGLEVSLAAGSDARTALTEGAPELQRLLEAVGRDNSRIVVRDLFGAAMGTTVSTNHPAAAPTGAGLPTDLAGGAGTGTGRPGGDTAAGQQSRDHATGNNGVADGAPGSANPSRPTESVTRAHPGVDVTM